MKKYRNTLRFVGRILIIWIIEVLGLLFMVWLLPGVRVDNLLTAVMAVAVIGVLNALLWPLLSYLMLPFAVLTLGLFSLVLNGVLVLLASFFVEGFEVATLWDGIAVTLGLTAINAIMSSLLTIDDDNSFHRNAVRRRIQRRKKPVETDVPGVLFLEFDGLSKPVLERAMSEGYLPTLANWLGERPGVSQIRTEGQEVRFLHAGQTEAEADLLRAMIEAGFRVVAFGSRQKSLEDVFMQVTKGLVQ